MASGGGAMFNKTTLKNHIYRLNWGEQVWEDTGVVIDDRPANPRPTPSFVDDPVNPQTLCGFACLFRFRQLYHRQLPPTARAFIVFPITAPPQTYTLDAEFPGDHR